MYMCKYTNTSVYIYQSGNQSTGYKVLTMYSCGRGHLPSPFTRTATRYQARKATLKWHDMFLLNDRRTSTSSPLAAVNRVSPRCTRNPSCQVCGVIGKFIVTIDMLATSETLLEKFSQFIFAISWNRFGNGTQCFVLKKGCDPLRCARKEAIMDRSISARRSEICSENKQKRRVQFFSDSIIERH